MSTAKQEAAAMIEKLPDDATFEDMQYRLYVMETMHERLKSVDAGEVVSQEEAKRRMAKWLQD